MAFLDSERGELIVCIVFDGSPLSGKTTTVRALAASLDGTVHSPEEMLGRTTYFDWLEYTGGLWNGHRIRCQLLTVPGQRSLGERRFELLRLADSVVFVFDSSSPQTVQSLAALEELTCVLEVCPQPRPAVLVQLNKRDVPSALNREEILARLPGTYPEIAETVATDSSGLRDVFIRAVRLALGRVEKLQAEGKLHLGRPRVRDSRQLLAALKAYENREAGSPADAVPLEVAAWSYLQALGEAGEAPTSGEAPAPSSGAPSPPTGEKILGAIWPPGRGRNVLQLCSELPHSLRPRPGGDWEITFGAAWEGLSRADHVFEDEEKGRKRLLELTRLAQSAEDWLSPDRCLTLSEAGGETWRLWEIKARRPSLRSLLGRPREGRIEVVVAALAQALRLYRRAGEAWPRQKLRRPLSPESCGLHLTRLVYTGFLPEPEANGAPPPPAGSVDEEVRRMARSYLEVQGTPLQAALGELRSLGEKVPDLTATADYLMRLLEPPVQA